MKKAVFVINGIVVSVPISEDYYNITLFHAKRAGIPPQEIFKEAFGEAFLKREKLTEDILKFYLAKL